LLYKFTKERKVKMRKIAKWNSIILSTCIILSTSIISTSSLVAKADEQTEESQLQGKVTMTMKFDSSETESAMEWFQKAKTQGEDFIKSQIATTDDPDKLQLLNEALKESTNLDTNDLFKVNADNSSNLKTPIANGQVTVDGVTVTTDENGNFSLDKVRPGDHDITVSLGGQVISQDSVKIDDTGKDETKNIDLTVDSADLQDAAKHMANSMATTQGIRYYQHYAKNTTLVYGNEGMKVVSDTDVVSCNEISKNSSSSSDIRSHLSETDFSKFPANGSDCATSIALGAIAQTNPVLAVLYHNSIFCDIEAAQAVGRRMHLTLSNIYCNGNYGGGHWNCSWFYGIGHSEKLHTDN
jgi:hypothetical protein